LLRQCCFDIVADVDRALGCPIELFVRSFVRSLSHVVTTIYYEQFEQF